LDKGLQPLVRLQPLVLAMTESGKVSMRTLVVFLVFGLVCSVAAFAQSVEEQGRAILEKHQKAVVTVQVVVKSKYSMMGMGSEEQESKQESTGFVIDPTGLVVLPLSSTDPGGMLESMMSAMGGEGNQPKIETTIGDVKVLLDDGKEIAAQVVLRDKDLDLAFVRTSEKPADPLPCIDLGQSGEAQVLDQVVALNRLGKVANRSSSVSLERIEAIVRKPRTFYLPGNDPTHSGLGSPVFTLDGKALGMLVMRTIKGESAGSFMDMMDMANGMLSIVLPAADILEAAKQAPAEVPKEAPAPAPAPEAPKEQTPEQGAVVIPNQPAAP